MIATLDKIESLPTTPGIYRGMAAETYHRMLMASNHRLGDLAQSPAHARYRMDNPSEPTPALVIGTAAHDLILEAVDRVKVSGPCVGQLVKGGRCKSNGKHLYHGEWYCGTHWSGDTVDESAGKSVLKFDDYTTVQAMAVAVRDHPAAAALLEQRAETELTCIWRDSKTKVLVKLRADGVVQGGCGICFDLKTIADDASPKSFEREIFQRGYHRQAALYLDGLNASDIPCEAFAFIVVEKAAPYGVACYELADEALAVGREENARLLERWAKCEASGHWPAYSDNVERIALPRWAMRQFEQE